MTRYDWDELSMTQDPTGQWVPYDEAQAEIDELRAQLEAAAINYTGGTATANVNPIVLPGGSGDKLTAAISPCGRVEIEAVQDTPGEPGYESHETVSVYLDTQQCLTLAAWLNRAAATDTR